MCDMYTHARTHNERFCQRSDSNGVMQSRTAKKISYYTCTVQLLYSIYNKGVVGSIKLDFCPNAIALKPPKYQKES